MICLPIPMWRQSENSFLYFFGFNRFIIVGDYFKLNYTVIEMNELKCIMPRCESVYRTTEPVHSSATYLCHLHGATIGEWHDYFQEYQFDPDLRRASRPLDTNHIQRQGQQLDTDEEQEIWASIQELSREKDGEE